MTPGNQAGEQQTPQTHSAHEGPQKNSQGYRRGADDQTQELEPDDLVDKGGTAAADKQHHQQRKHPAADRGFRTILDARNVHERLQIPFI